jgi:hypothetical protein
MTALPNGRTFNAQHYTYRIEIPKRIIAWWKEKVAGSSRKLIGRADNARPHTAKLSVYFMDAKTMTRTPHPPYLPDSASSEFLLFGNVKRHLSGCSFDHTDDLLTTGREILGDIDKLALIRAFEEWVKRLEQCIEMEGEYVR